jgi:hypothetical protein
MLELKTNKDRITVNYDAQNLDKMKKDVETIITYLASEVTHELVLKSVAAGQRQDIAESKISKEWQKFGASLTEKITNTDFLNELYIQGHKKEKIEENADDKTDVNMVSDANFEEVKDNENPETN